MIVCFIELYFAVQIHDRRSDANVRQSGNTISIFSNHIISNALKLFLRIRRHSVSRSLPAILAPLRSQRCHLPRLTIQLVTSASLWSPTSKKSSVAVPLNLKSSTLWKTLVTIWAASRTRYFLVSMFVSDLIRYSSLSVSAFRMNTSTICSNSFANRLSRRSCVNRSVPALHPILRTHLMHPIQAIPIKLKKWCKYPK